MMVKAERMVGDVKVTEIHEQGYRDGEAIIKVSFTATSQNAVSPRFPTEEEAIAFITNYKKEAA
jgi:hypothetical protein